MYTDTALAKACVGRIYPHTVGLMCATPRHAQRTCVLPRQCGRRCSAGHACNLHSLFHHLRTSTTCARHVQVLKSNVASLTHVIVPVHAAVVDTATAEGQKTLTLKGRGSEYWGFRVDHNGRKQEDTVTYEVETRTLAQIQVRCLCTVRSSEMFCAQLGFVGLVCYGRADVP